jgi:hypothetical protein
MGDGQDLITEVATTGIRRRHPEWEDQVAALLPYQRAGMRGLTRSTWQPGQPADDLVAPIVLSVLAEVARQGVLSGGGGDTS